PLGFEHACARCGHAHGHGGGNPPALAKQLHESLREIPHCDIRLAKWREYRARDALEKITDGQLALNCGQWPSEPQISSMSWPSPRPRASYKFVGPAANLVFANLLWGLPDWGFLCHRSWHWFPPSFMSTYPGWEERENFVPLIFMK